MNETLSTLASSFPKTTCLSFGHLSLSAFPLLPTPLLKPHPRAHPGMLHHLPHAGLLSLPHSWDGVK